MPRKTELPEIETAAVQPASATDAVSLDGAAASRPFVLTRFLQVDPSITGRAERRTASKKMAYEPALDGIRAVAIVAVLLFHGGLSWIPGGFLGVDVFFVLSGYLITRLLLTERETTGRIDVAAFYARRARRLLPALFVMLAVTLTCACWFMRDAALSTVRDLPWALTGLSNWWFVFHHQSYFEAMGRPPLFQHTWSLAVEFQFYWIWPMLLVLLFPIAGEFGIGALALLCGGVSAAALALTQSSSHAYFGTDTHSLGLFLGSALAAARCYYAGRFKTPPKPAAWLPNALGAAALLVLLTLFHVVGENTDTRYRLGLAATAIGTVVLIVAASVDNGIVSRCLSVRPLRWLGERSYSIYVWHWPVFQATRPQIDLPLHPLPALCLRLALTFAIAELSYRYVESPVRRGALGRLLSATRSMSRVRRTATCSILVSAVLVLTFFEIRLASAAIRQNRDELNAAAAMEKAAAVASHLPAKARPSNEQDLARVPALIVGDSVLLGVTPYLKQRLDITGIDATVGRQAKELYARIQELAAAGQIPSLVILDLGNNGTVEEDTLKGILDQLKACRKVVVVNARVPRRWQDGNDRLLAQVVPSYPNAVLADWRFASDNHPEYFGADGVHPGVKGARAYADVVLTALQLKPGSPKGFDRVSR